MNKKSKLKKKRRFTELSVVQKESTKINTLSTSKEHQHKELNHGGLLRKKQSKRHSNPEATFEEISSHFPIVYSPIQRTLDESQTVVKCEADSLHEEDDTSPSIQNKRIDQSFIFDQHGKSPPQERKSMSPLSQHSTDKNLTHKKSSPQERKNMSPISSQQKSDQSSDIRKHDTSSPQKKKHILFHEASVDYDTLFPSTSKADNGVKWLVTNNNNTMSFEQNIVERKTPSFGQNEKLRKEKKRKHISNLNNPMEKVDEVLLIEKKSKEEKEVELGVFGKQLAEDKEVSYEQSKKLTKKKKKKKQSNQNDFQNLAVRDDVNKFKAHPSQTNIVRNKGLVSSGYKDKLKNNKKKTRKREKADSHVDDIEQNVGEDVWLPFELSEKSTRKKKGNIQYFDIPSADVNVETGQVENAYEGRDSSIGDNWLDQKTVEVQKESTRINTPSISKESQHKELNHSGLFIRTEQEISPNRKKRKRHSNPEAATEEISSHFSIVCSPIQRMSKSPVIVKHETASPQKEKHTSSTQNKSDQNFTIAQHEISLLPEKKQMFPLSQHTTVKNLTYKKGSPQERNNLAHSISSQHISDQSSDIRKLDTASPQNKKHKLFHEDSVDYDTLFPSTSKEDNGVKRLVTNNNKTMSFEQNIVERKTPPFGQNEKLRKKKKKKHISDLDNPVEKVEEVLLNEKSNEEKEVELGVSGKHIAEDKEVSFEESKKVTKKKKKKKQSSQKDFHNLAVKDDVDRKIKAHPANTNNDEDWDFVSPGWKDKPRNKKRKRENTDSDVDYFEQNIVERKTPPFGQNEKLRKKKKKKKHISDLDNPVEKVEEVLLNEKSNEEKEIELGVSGKHIAEDKEVSFEESKKVTKKKKKKKQSSQKDFHNLAVKDDVDRKIKAHPANTIIDEDWDFESPGWKDKPRNKKIKRENTDSDVDYIEHNIENVWLPFELSEKSTKEKKKRSIQDFDIPSAEVNKETGQVENINEGRDSSIGENCLDQKTGKGDEFDSGQNGQLMTKKRSKQHRKRKEFRLSSTKLDECEGLIDDGSEDDELPSGQREKSPKKSYWIGGEHFLKSPDIGEQQSVYEFHSPTHKMSSNLDYMADNSNMENDFIALTNVNPGAAWEKVLQTKAVKESCNDSSSPDSDSSVGMEDISKILSDYSAHFCKKLGRKPPTTHNLIECPKCKKMVCNLNTHFVVHAEKILECEYCDYKTARRRDLNIHAFVHNNIRQFKCPICLKAFPIRSDLNKHLKVHSDDRKFTCDICNKSYKHAHHLKRHNKMQHEDVDEKDVISNS